MSESSMNAPRIPSDMQTGPIKLVPCCINFRHKLMYVDDRHRQIGMVNTDSDTRIYFCNQTGDCLGEDGKSVSPRECCSSRSCYRAAPGALPVPTDHPLSEGRGSYQA